MSAAVYGLENGVQTSDASLYLRDFSYAYHCYRLNGFWNPILTNKLVMSRVLAAAGLPAGGSNRPGATTRAGGGRRGNQKVPMIFL